MKEHVILNQEKYFSTWNERNCIENTTMLVFLWCRSSKSLIIKANNFRNLQTWNCMNIMMNRTVVGRLPWSGFRFYELVGVCRLISALNRIRGGGVIAHVTPWPTVPKMLHLNYARWSCITHKLRLEFEGGCKGI